MGSRTGYIGNPERHTYEDLWRYQFNSYSCLGATRGCVYAQANSVWPNSGGTIALGAAEYPTGISINGNFYNYDDTDQSIELFICDSSGGNTYSLGKHSFSPGETYGAGNFNKSGQSWTKLQGKTIALKKGYGGTGYADFGVGWWEQATVVITTALVYTACGAPGWCSGSSPAEGNITLSWGAGSAGTSNAVSDYEVQYRDKAPGGSYGGWTAYSTTKSTSMTVSPHGTRGGYRQFRVRTRGTAGASYYSGWRESNEILRNTLPGAPTNLSASPAVWESGNVNLSWTAAAKGSSNISGYYLSYRTKTNDGDWSGWSSETAIGNVTSYNVSPSLDRGAQIQHRIRTVDVLGAYSGYAEFSAVQRNQIPGQPGALTVSPTLWETGDISLSWTEASATTSSISGYQIQVSIWSAGNNAWGAYADVAVVGNVTSYDAAAPAFIRGGKIKYRICTVDALGVLSDWVESGEIVRNSLPGKPGAMTVAPQLYESGGITVSWGASSDVDGNILGYQLQYAVSADGTVWDEWADVSASVPDTSCVFEPGENVLPRGSRIKFRVRAFDGTETEIWAYGEFQESSIVKKNQKPLTPVFVYPAVNSLEGMAPAVKVRYFAEPEGTAQTITLAAQRNGSTVWTRQFSLTAEEGAVCARINLQTAGEYTLTAVVNDGLVSSEAGTMTLAVRAASWRRAIASGDVIASPTVSHQADIAELIEKANAKREAYGLAEIAPEGNGYWASWQPIMDALVNAMAEVYAQVGETIQQVETTSYPSAAVVNAIRDLIAGA